MAETKRLNTTSLLFWLDQTLLLSVGMFIQQSMKTEMERKFWYLNLRHFIFIGSAVDRVVILEWRGDLLTSISAWTSSSVYSAHWSQSAYIQPSTTGRFTRVRSQIKVCLLEIIGHMRLVLVSIIVPWGRLMMRCCR